MKNGVLALFALFIFSGSDAFSMDHRSQYGVGGSLGLNFAAPWTSELFRDAVSAKIPAASAWGRWIAGTPEIGLELSYNYIALGKMDFSAHTAILSFISRQNPWGNFHPLYGFGVGYANTTNKFAGGKAGEWEDPIMKLTAGIEFEMNNRLDLGLRVDHYSIFRDTNSQRSMHILSPSLSINYYFGTPAPLPTAAPPAPPAPAPAVAPVPSTPTVVPPTTTSPSKKMKVLNTKPKKKYR